MKDADDSTLVAKAVSGDGSAYGELFALYEKRIYNYAYGILGNSRGRRRRRPGRLCPRLPGACRQGRDAQLLRLPLPHDSQPRDGRDQAAQPLRRTHALELEHEPSLQADPEKVTLLAEQQEQTWRAASQLSENHRAVLALRELHDMSYQEIADVMEMPRATVGVCSPARASSSRRRSE